VNRDGDLANRSHFTRVVGRNERDRDASASRAGRSASQSKRSSVIIEGVKLAPLQLETLANAICGGEGTPIDYRSGEQLRRFRAFVGADVDWETGSSRFYDTLAYLEACNETPAGSSGLPSAIEKVIVALLDRRQFDSHVAQDDALTHVASVFEAMPVDVHLGTGARSS
jgi:hypothetical protein